MCQQLISISEYGLRNFGKHEWLWHIKYERHKWVIDPQKTLQKSWMVMTIQAIGKKYSALIKELFIAHEVFEVVQVGMKKWATIQERHKKQHWLKQIRKINKDLLYIPRGGDSKNFARISKVSRFKGVLVKYHDVEINSIN